jgi:DNA invertase Pin-like site-specific DNA recombinase
MITAKPSICYNEGVNRAEILRVIGYIRVSTIEQADSGAGLEAQRAAIAAYARSRRWELVTIFEDHVSGKSLNGRPELRNALAELKAKRADAIVVAKLDRLSRSIHDLSGLMEVSRKQGWALVALDFDLDTSTPMGEAMANMAGTFAQLERRLIGERTKDALAIRKAQGVRLGRPRSIGLALERRILRLRRAGKSFQAIADRLTADGVPTPGGGPAWSWGTIERVVRRQVQEPIRHRTRAT